MHTGNAENNNAHFEGLKRFSETGESHVSWLIKLGRRIQMIQTRGNTEGKAGRDNMASMDGQDSGKMVFSQI